MTTAERESSAHDGVLQTELERAQLVLRLMASSRDRYRAERDTLLAALHLTVTALEVWPGTDNPEFFPAMKAARSAIAKVEGR